MDALRVFESGPNLQNIPVVNNHFVHERPAPVSDDLNQTILSSSRDELRGRADRRNPTAVNTLGPSEFSAEIVNRNETAVRPPADNSTDSSH